MAASLESIRHPVARSLVGACVGFSAATLLSASAVGLLGRNDQQAVRTVGFATAIGTVLGAIAGAVLPPTMERSASQSPAIAPAEQAWTDWRNFIVVRKVQESTEITSFYLQPEDGKPLPPFQPGQFLTIRLNISDQPRPVIRTYSLSDYVDPVHHYRLSIKREPAPKDLDVPPGIASNFMHDHVQVGTVIPAKPPSGKFVLNVNEPHPIVLISNGVGITPMISMAKAVAQHHPQRPVWFLHGARNGKFHAFRDEVAVLSEATLGLRVYYRYSRPQAADTGKFHSQGYIDTAMLETVVLPALREVDQPQNADYFLCGSPAFLDAIRTGLQALGVPEHRVYFESFAKPKVTQLAPATPTAAATTASVTFARSGKTATWTAGDGTLLEFAENQGLTPDYSCRQGICLTCMCRLQAGDVDYHEPPTGTPEAGSVLICIAQPKTDEVVLDL